MKLEEIRERIDHVDRELLSLIEERLDLGLRTRAHKGDVADSEREKVVISRARHTKLGLIEPDFAERLFGEIIDQSKRKQREVPHLVAFQGDHGAYSEVAARGLVPAGAYIPCVSFDEVVRGVEQGYFDRGVVPVENSLEGAVTAVNDLLTTTSLKAIGEYHVRVRHCLLAAPGTDYRDIRTVFSHPEALSQCRGFLARNKLEPRPFYDTAGAARMVARDTPRAAAAIASQLCAELHGLEIIKEGVEDDSSNSTRFLMLSRDVTQSAGDKCSIIFSTAHEAGALFAVLGLFAQAGINLTRIASKPLRSEPGNYAFFLDFEGTEKEPSIAEVLKKMEDMTVTMKYLGSYPAANGDKVEGKR